MAPASTSPPHDGPPRPTRAGPATPRRAIRLDDRGEIHASHFAWPCLFISLGLIGVSLLYRMVIGG